MDQTPLSYALDVKSLRALNFLEGILSFFSGFLWNFNSFLSRAFLQYVKIDVNQFSRSVVSNSLRAHGQHARFPCPSPIPRACSNSCPSSWWCHSTILSSVIPLSSCLQSFPASGSLPVSQFFASGVHDKKWFTYYTGKILFSWKISPSIIFGYYFYTLKKKQKLFFWKMTQPNVWCSAFYLLHYFLTYYLMLFTSVILVYQIFLPHCWLFSVLLKILFFNVALFQVFIPNSREVLLYSKENIYWSLMLSLHFSRLSCTWLKCVCGILDMMPLFSKLSLS